jgi:hypothetical protein
MLLHKNLKLLGTSHDARDLLLMIRDYLGLIVHPVGHTVGET